MPKTKPVTDGHASVNAERYKTQFGMTVNRFGGFFVNRCGPAQALNADFAAVRRITQPPSALTYGLNLLDQPLQRRIALAQGQADDVQVKGLQLKWQLKQLQRQQAGEVARQLGR